MLNSNYTNVHHKVIHMYIDISTDMWICSIKLEYLWYILDPPWPMTSHDPPRHRPGSRDNSSASCDISVDATEPTTRRDLATRWTLGSTLISDET